MKQTAVEWFIQKTSDMKIDKTHYIISEWEDGYNVALEALEMEKKQIIDSYNQGYRDGEDDSSGKDISLYNDADLYYNENFKNDKL